MADLYQGITVYGLNSLAGQPSIGTPGAVAPAAALQIAGFDGTNLRTILTDATGALVVTGSITATNPSVTPTAAAVPASATYIGGNKSGNLVGLLLDGSGSLQVREQGTVTVTGTVTANAGSGTFTVAGSKTNNSAAPGATNVGVLPALANTAAPTYSDGNQVLLSTDTAGSLRVTQQGTVTVTGTVALSGTSAINVTQVGGSAIGLGQKTSANSFPVVLASDQSRINTSDASDGTNGAAIPSISGLVGGSDGTNLQPIRVSTNRTQVVIPANEALAASVSWFSADNGTTPVACDAVTGAPILTIRSNSASVVFTLRGIDVMSGGQQTRYQIIKNATLTGATFATSLGNVQIDTAATVASSGTVVASGYFGSNKTLKDLVISIAAGTPGDRYTIYCKAISGTSNVLGSLQWTESAAAL